MDIFLFILFALAFLLLIGEVSQIGNPISRSNLRHEGVSEDDFQRWLQDAQKEKCLAEGWPIKHQTPGTVRQVSEAGQSLPTTAN
jgi:hypothetical protein